MSKAGEFARHKPKELHLPQVGSPYAESFEVDPDGRLLIGNSGPFTKRNVLRLIRWLRDTFEDRPGGRGEG